MKILGSTDNHCLGSNSKYTPQLRVTESTFTEILSFLMLLDQIIVADFLKARVLCYGLNTPPVHECDIGYILLFATTAVL